MAAPLQVKNDNTQQYAVNRATKAAGVRPAYGDGSGPMELIQMLGHNTKSSVDGTSKQEAGADLGSMKAAAQVESYHEAIALLQQPNGNSSLCINWANWNLCRSAVENDAPTLVVSFLGDTEVGKSHTIRELMSPTEERPFVQKGRDQKASTTFNVNLYSCRSMVRDTVVHLLDFEGENGSEAPILAMGRNRAGNTAVPGAAGLFGVSCTPFTSLAAAGGSAVALSSSSVGQRRSEAVREHFPRLAYTTSDVVALVGTDPFFSTRYLERAVDFAKRANAGVCDVDLPVLLLISNKRDGDRCILDIKESTAQFVDAMGDSFRLLDQYFSALLCVYLPNKRNTTVGDDGVVYEGENLYAMQMGKLRTVLAALMKARLSSRYGGADGGGSGSRLITCRQGLWFDLVPRIVRELNAGRPVHVTRLVDEAWTTAMTKVSTQAEAVGDILKALVAGLRPHPSLSTSNEDFLTRFAGYHALVLDLTVRIAAARLRHVEPNLRFPVRIRAYARVQLDMALSLLDGVTPCCAVYGAGPGAASQGETGVPVDKPSEPVMCLQEHRVHRKGHRSGRKIRGGGRTLWQKFTHLSAYSPAWAGKFHACPVASPDMEALLADVTALVDAPPEEFVLALGTARLAHSSSYTNVSLIPLVAGTTQARPAARDDLGMAGTTTGLIRLTPTPAANQTACLPYCIGCTRKVLLVNNSEDAPDLSSKEVQPAAIGVEHQSWLASTFYVVLESVGMGGAPVESNVDAGGRAVALRAAQHSTAVQNMAKGQSSGGDVPVVQEVPLGLCSECWDAAIAANSYERSRRAQARLAMTQVE